MTAREIDRLRGPILRSVSRSFYLSLRTLPRPLRDPLSLAYLLARATDTIADTAEVSVEMRAQSLRDLAGVIQGTAPDEAVERVRNKFGSRQNNQAERTLIEALPAIILWLDALDGHDRAEVRKVLKTINAGQMLDLERFGAGTRIGALPTAAALDEYTYLVAGCVGEFWTRICFAHVPDFSVHPEPEMMELGVQYGKGLQLINILRDVGADLRQGRCYLPAEELHSLGLTPEEILEHSARVEPIIRRWREKAEGGMKAGIEYACAIRSRRIRFATALPALIGARTLALLREAGGDVFHRTVKVPRAEVKKIMASTALTFATVQSLRRMFGRLSR